MYDLLLQNQASKKTYVVSGLIDKSESVLSYLFSGFTMPVGAQEGEYVCALFWNGRRDVVYDLKDSLLDTVARTGEGDIQIRFLLPEIFILKYGKITSPYASKDQSKEYYYRKND